MESARPLARQQDERLFFAAMGLFVAIVVFAGFASSYYLSRWLTPPARTPRITPLLHLHALLFTAWILLGAVQPALIAAGRPNLHRTLGVCGAVLAVAVWAFGNLAAATAMTAGFEGVGDPYAFYSVTFFSIQGFGIIVLLAMLRRKDGDAHKRLMLLSSASILEAAVGRLPVHAMAAAAPLSFYVGADLVIIAGAAYDLASRGAVHRIWLWGGGALIASQVLRVAIMHTAPWLAFAHAVASLA